MFSYFSSVYSSNRNVIYIYSLCYSSNRNLINFKDKPTSVNFRTWKNIQLSKKTRIWKSVSHLAVWPRKNLLNQPPSWSWAMGELPDLGIVTRWSWWPTSTCILHSYPFISSISHALQIITMTSNSFVSPMPKPSDHIGSFCSIQTYKARGDGTGGSGTALHPTMPQRNAHRPFSCWGNPNLPCWKIYRPVEHSHTTNVFASSASELRSGTLSGQWSGNTAMRYIDTYMPHILPHASITP